MSRHVLALPVATACFLSACGTMNAALNETTQTVEYYRVFDVRTPQQRGPVIEAARKGLSRNAVNIQDARPIPPAERPTQPGRFTTSDPFNGTQLGALTGRTGGAMIKGVICDGSVWMANATRTVGDATAKISLCLWEYNAGYHLDIYANYLKKEGGIGLRQLAGAAATAIVGTFEEALEKTVNDVARELQTAGATVSYVEGYPDPIGEPWWSKSEPVAIQPIPQQPQAAAQPVAPAPAPIPVSSAAREVFVAGQMATVQSAGGRLYPGGTSSAEALTPGSSVQLISKTQNASGTWWFVDFAGRRGYVQETDLSQLAR